MTRDEALKLGKRYFLKDLKAKKEMASLYKELYGEVICNYCDGDIKQAFETIYTLRDQPLCKYKLKPKGKISNIDGHWTNFNLTDEIAERLIEQGYKDSFV